MKHQEVSVQIEQVITSITTSSLLFILMIYQKNFISVSID